MPLPRCASPLCSWLGRSYGIPKPAYRAFQLLHATGTQRFPVSVPGALSATFGALGTKNATHATLLFWNHNLPNMTAATPTVSACVAVQGGYSAAVLATVTLLDETHGNAPRLWLKMGAPAYPSATQIAALKAASEPSTTQLTVSARNGALVFNVALKPYALLAYTFALP